MAEKSLPTYLEIEGILGDVMPEIFRRHLPHLLDLHRTDRVQMLVTTQTANPREQMEHGGSSFRPGRGGDSAQFTWKARGVFHAVIRQFRLDFLRHLTPTDHRCQILLAIYPEQMDWTTVEAAPEVKAPANEPTIHADAGETQNRSQEIPPTPRRAAASRESQRNAVAAHGSTLGAGAWGEHGAAVPKLEDEPETREPPEPPQSTPTSPARVIDATPPPTTTGAPSLLGNLYQEFFGFDLMPFNNTPDSTFYFPTDKHQEALSRLLYAISERKGFVMISGEVGAGKTTLCRSLLKQLPNEVKTALITHTHLDAMQLVIAIAEDLGIEVDGMSRYEVLRALYDYLIRQLAQGCTVCIIIDEAQNLSPAALEEVRMISNLETEREKLVQLILLGQPELREKVRLPSMRQLRQRISVQYHLDPLTRRETVGYIRHRIKVANASGELHFRRAAMVEAFRYSGGVPRLINTLCDNALLTAFTRRKRTVTARMIAEAARDLDLDPQTGGLAQFFKVW